MFKYHRQIHCQVLIFETRENSRGGQQKYDSRKTPSIKTLKSILESCKILLKLLNNQLLMNPAGLPCLNKRFHILKRGLRQQTMPQV